MKKITLFFLLFFPILGFSQTNRDSIIMLNTQTNPNLLLNSVASNLIDAGKSYENSENLLILGTLSMVVGSIVYSKQISNKTPGKISDSSSGKLFIGLGAVLNISSIVCRYTGHNNLTNSGKELKNYVKSLK